MLITKNRKLIIIIYTVIFAFLTGCNLISNQIETETQNKQSAEEKRFDPIILVNEDTFRLTGEELKEKDTIKTESNPWLETVNDYYGHAAKVYYFREGTESHNTVNEIVYYVTIEDKEEFIEVYNLLLNDMTVIWGEDYITTINLNYTNNQVQSEFTEQDIRTAIDDKENTATFRIEWENSPYSPQIFISILRNKNKQNKLDLNSNNIQISFSQE